MHFLCFSSRSSFGPRLEDKWVHNNWSDDIFTQTFGLFSRRNFCQTFGKLLLTRLLTWSTKFQFCFKKTVLEVKLWTEMFNVNTCEETDFKMTFSCWYPNLLRNGVYSEKSGILNWNKCLFSFTTNLAYSKPVEIKKLIQ